MGKEEIVLVLKSGNKVVGIINPTDNHSFGEMCLNLKFDGVDEILIMFVEDYKV